MSDPRSEDRDQPDTPARSGPAASDLLAMWVTGSTEHDAPAGDEAPGEPGEPGVSEVSDEESYAESLWPGDEPPAAGQGAETVGSEQWWPYAEPDGAPSDDTVSAAEPDEPAARAPESMGPRGLDMTTTASWTLDDFEAYVRSQKDNELADWIATDPTDRGDAPFAEPDDAFSAEAAEPAAAIQAAPSPVTDPAVTEDAEDVDPLDEPEVEVEWNPPEGEAPTRALVDVEPDAWPDESPQRDDTDWSGLPEPTEAVAGSDPDQVPLFDDDLASDQPAPAIGPDPLDDVWPEPPAQVEPETLSDSEPALEPEPLLEEALEPVPAEPVTAEPVTEPSAGPVGHDLQEWYDDYGLRWVSGDGGYTWYSDDNQGWDAQHSEVIAVAPGFVPFPGDPRSPGFVAQPAADGPPAALEPAPVEPEADLGPEPEADLEPEQVALEAEPEPAPDPDGWPVSSIPVSSHYAALGEDDARWPDETGPQPRIDPATTQQMSALTTSPEPARETPTPDDDCADDETSYNLYADQPASARFRRRDSSSTDEDAAGTDDASFPEQVDYKPRGAFRPLLILLFVGAAVIAVAAILWAVSKGNQAVWGIAAAITGFTLFFWWGLLSWTPTLVSIDGPMLEVSRGSEGERFDLRSPRLDIEVDDDVYSRSWRTTIVRPNGTELVIPSSAVDAEEFSRIVGHYRSETVR